MAHFHETATIGQVEDPEGSAVRVMPSSLAGRPRANWAVRNGHPRQTQKAKYKLVALIIGHKGRYIALLGQPGFPQRLQSSAIALRRENCYLPRVVLVRMRMDIRPRCCVHHESVMVPVEVCGKIDGHPYSFGAFACEAGCDQLYNIIHGYFRLSGGKISSLSQFRRPCPNDESPMYLESDDVEKSGVVTYSCSQLGCGGKRTG